MALTPSEKIDLIEAAAKMRETAATFDEIRERRSRALVGHNTVIRTVPGLYLTPRDGGYGVAGLQHAVIFTPEEAQAQLVECRRVGAKDAQAVAYNNALETEAHELRKIAAHIESKTNA